MLSGRIAALSPSRRSSAAAFAPSVPISRYLARSELCVGTESLMCFQRLAGGFLVGKQPLAVKLEPTGNLFRTALGFSASFELAVQLMVCGVTAEPPSTLNSLLYAN